MMALGAVGIAAKLRAARFLLSSEKAIAIGLRSGEQAADRATKRAGS